MIGLLQRVSSGSVRSQGRVLGEIGRGIVVLVGVHRDDDEQNAERLLQRLLSYRVFPDSQGRMNRSVSEAGGGVLLVPQFTLAADTRKGTRASFSSAAEPQQASELFEYLYIKTATLHQPVVRGEFGADMQVSLVNDGPVTFWLET